ncbi:hypothetical protein [Thiothrix nivea]|uniref:Uncharacterized protein n=1 Tax=Thiothrix nivea (strain ATCC 35100 / DSM 5205 / JP2) TaxID=870187 RepID=A0A656HL85_THINJ|nr:hypothetical protein [Thiothrix nivea]EIJ37063.1 hypothetical protein Thini_0054 [Thiothrix nivea DSM 5205]
MPERRCLDEATLTRMVEEIAELLSNHLPGGGEVALRAESARTHSKRYAQMFAFRPEQGGVFSVSAEIRCPPPDPANLNLKCVTAK